MCSPFCLDLIDLLFFLLFEFVCSYQNYLRKSRMDNFQDMANLGAFYKAGTDYMGRQIVIFVGKHVPATKIDMDKVSP